MSRSLPGIKRLLHQEPYICPDLEVILLLFPRWPLRSASLCEELSAAWAEASVSAQSFHSPPTASPVSHQPVEPAALERLVIFPLLFSCIIHPFLLCFSCFSRAPGRLPLLLPLTSPCCLARSNTSASASVTAALISDECAYESCPDVNNIINATVWSLHNECFSI